MARLVFDIESNGLLDTVSRIWCIVIKDLDTGAVDRYNDQPIPRNIAGNISEAVDRLCAASILVAHNGLDYDYRAILKVLGVDLGRHKIVDTMLLGRLINPERSGGHSLESYGEEFGLPKGDHSDFSQWSIEMEDYCVNDVEITYRCAQKFLRITADWGRSAELEHACAWVVLQQRDNGFGLDERAATELAATYLDEMNGLEAELRKAFPPIYVADKEFTPKKDLARMGYVGGARFTKIKIQEFNPGSGPQIEMRFRRKYGWKPRKFTDQGAAATDESVLKGLPYPEAAILARFARLDKQWGQIAAPKKKNGTGGGWLQHCVNGRVHGYVNTNGAVTGRMTHSKPNSANIDKEPKMRALWIPRIGWVLVGCDAEGLELRALGHYLAPYDGGAYARAVVEGKKEDGTDAHSLTKKIAGLYSRDSAKTLIYAMIYGAGDPKVGSIIVADAREAGKYTAEDSPHLFHKGKKKTNAQLGREVRAKIETGITGLGQLKKAILSKVKRDGWIRGIDGRKLRIRSEHSALNTALQSCGGIAMKVALVILYDDLTAAGYVHGVDYAFCANVHDEWQIETPTHDMAEIVGKAAADAIRKAGESLNLRVPLAGAYAIGQNWSETH